MKTIPLIMPLTLGVLLALVGTHAQGPTPISLDMAPTCTRGEHRD